MQRKIFGWAAVFVALLLFISTHYAPDLRATAQTIGELYNAKVSVYEITDRAKDKFITHRFPAVKRIFQVENAAGETVGHAFIVQTTGYNGPLTMAVGIDDRSRQTTGLKVLEHRETPEYARYLTEKWFTDRFKAKSVAAYLHRVVLDPRNPQDVVQITGATVSSEAVVNGVNSAIGAFDYLVEHGKMAAVPVNVDKKLLSADDNSFAINCSQQSVRIRMDELYRYPTVKVNTVLVKTTGTRKNMTVEGPLLADVLKQHGICLQDYQGIGVTGSDGYYALLAKDILAKRQVILAYRFNGQAITAEDKPVRVVVPGEMGVYWVRMVTNIDLYQDIPPKKIKSVKIFNALTRDIAPYAYEYYGHKDKAIEVGKILAKFKNVNSKGFFTMASSDGLVKNETIMMVRQRYYLKITGDNAPMNIAPNFKLGMNVKRIAYFSTTADAVIFPAEMVKLTGTAKLAGKSGMPLAQVLDTVGVTDPAKQSYLLVSTSGQKLKITGHALAKCILIEHGQKITVLYQAPDGLRELDDLLEINCL